jgi:hypothetical protein
MNQKIRVMLGTDIKREAVLINPSVSAAEPTITAENVNQETPTNVIATGENSRQILKNLYGRR